MQGTDSQNQVLWRKELGTQKKARLFLSDPLALGKKNGNGVLWFSSVLRFPIGLGCSFG